MNPNDLRRRCIALAFFNAEGAEVRRGRRGTAGFSEFLCGLCAISASSAFKNAPITEVSP